MLLLWILLGAAHAALTISGEEKISGQELTASDLKVQGRLSVKNSPFIYIRRDFDNEGVVTLKTDAAAQLPPKSRLEYTFAGFFGNAGLFLVQYNSPSARVAVRIAATPGPQYQLTNMGDMVFACGANTAGHSFRIWLHSWLYNHGSICVAGVPGKPARLHIHRGKAPRPTGLELPPRLINSGVLFVQNGEMHQRADILGAAGCIALGEGGVFAANASHALHQQEFFFMPGNSHSTLVIRSEGALRNVEYFVKRFPRNSRIQVDLHLTEVDIGVHGAVEFSSILTDDATVTVYFGQEVSEENFRFVDGVFTYDGDLGDYHKPQTWELVKSARKMVQLHKLT